MYWFEVLKLLASLTHLERFLQILVFFRIKTGRFEGFYFVTI